jgi:16S rRNA (cytidine1402-2'-O)-methyltransferase
MNKSYGILYLIPNHLGGGVDKSATAEMQRIIISMQHFVVEEIKSARRWLRGLGYAGNFEDIQFILLNEHKSNRDIPEALALLLSGNNVGLISEAGLPCVADPGGDLVAMCHHNKIRVVPLTGPSSIFLTLMASGMNGQSFAFNGYLPKEAKERERKIKQLEQLSLQGQTQLFMDAPYRNDQVLQALCAICRPDTALCIATEITTDQEQISTKSIDEWKRHPPALHKRTVMFCMGKMLA